MTSFLENRHFKDEKSGSDGDAAGEKSNGHHHQGYQPGQRDSLLLVSPNASAQAHQQENGRGQGRDGEADPHPAQDSGAANVGSHDAEALALCASTGSTP